MSCSTARRKTKTVVAPWSNPGGRRTKIRNQIASSIAHASATGLARPAHTKHQQRHKRYFHHSSASRIAAYVGAFLLLVTVVAIGYESPQKANGQAAVVSESAVNTSLTADDTAPSVDKVVATSVAADLAERTDLPVALNAANLSVSLAIKSELAQASSTASASAKPQLISADSSINRDIRTYVVKKGDTVPSVAAKYGVSSDTIRWANGLGDTDALSAGKKLKIPPVSGVIYTVKSGDTLQSIADKYSTNADRIKTYNNLELSGVKAGKTLIIPDGIKPAPTPPPAPVVTAFPSGDLGGSVIGAGINATGGNRYAFGNCTYYAYERRMQLGMPIGGNWGNANTWGYSARAAGFRVDNTPSTGAVLVDTAGYFGHVAVVERVKGNGDIVISEMNNYAYGGFNIVNNRTISAGQAAVYQYIH